MSDTQNSQARPAAPTSRLLEAARKAHREGRYSQVIDLVRVIIGRDEDLGEQWGRIADLAAAAGDRFSAVKAQRRYAASRPEDDDRRMKLARHLNSSGRLDEALEITEALSAKHPTSAPAAFRVANFSFFKGDMDRAREMFRRTLALNPDDVESWNQLVKLDLFEPGDPAYAEMEALAGRLRKAGKASDLSNLQFALGDAYDRAGAHDRAYEHYSEGQSIMALERPYDPERERLAVERLGTAFSETFYKRVKETGNGHDSSRPIFVMAMPRSGTTLLEQLLTTHSEVADGGELEWMRIACYPLGNFTGPDLKRFEAGYGQIKAPGGGFGRIGSVYLRFMEEEFGPQGRIVDKSLDLPFYAGPALAALPNASFVWIRRDPRDVALSVFKTRFLNRHDWTWAWDRIAHRLVHNYALQKHFTELFPEKILFIPYEQLVSDPDAWTPRLLEHCGLPVEDVQNSFHKTDRAVKTASKTQVRQPISTKSIGSWRRYEEHMRPFFDTFEKIWPEKWGDPYQAP